MPTLPFPKTQAEMERYRSDPNIQFVNGQWQQSYAQPQQPASQPMQTTQTMNAPASMPLNTPQSMPVRNDAQVNAPVAPMPNYVSAPQGGQQFSGNVMITNKTTGARGGYSVAAQPQVNPVVSQVAQAIAGVESSNRYSAVGPATQKGNRAYGKYQIMDFNIGPWSKEILGYEVSPQQFLANPQLQDAIALGKLQKYYDQYGNADDVAAVWFSGRPLKGNKSQDILGTTVPAYVQKVRAAMGTMPQNQGTTLANYVEPSTSVQSNVNQAFPQSEPIELDLGPISPTISNEMFERLFNQPSTTADVDRLLTENTRLRERYLNELLPTQQEQELRQQLVDIRSQADQEALRTQAGLFSLEEQPIAMPIIGTQQEKLFNQANLRLQTIASQESKLLAELGLEQESREARMQVVGTLLEFNEQDQERAFRAQQAIRQERQDLFNNLLSLNQVQQKQFNTIMDSLQGVRFDDLSTNSQMQIAQLATQVGVPIGVVAQGMKVMADQLDFERLRQEKADFRADAELQVQIAALQAQEVDNATLVDAVQKNPALFNTLDSKTQTAILPTLTQQGFQPVEKLPATQITGFVDLQNVKDLANRIEGLLQEGVSTGPVANIFGKIAGVAGLEDESRQELRNLTADLFRTVLKATSGVAASEREVDRLKSFLPDPGRQESVNKNRINDFLQTLKETEYNAIERFAAQGFDVSGQLQVLDNQLRAEVLSGVNVGSLAGKLKEGEGLVLDRKTGDILAITQQEYDPIRHLIIQ